MSGPRPLADRDVRAPLPPIKQRQQWYDAARNRLYSILYRGRSL